MRCITALLNPWTVSFLCTFKVRKGFWKPPPQMWSGDASKIRVLDPHFLHQTAEKLLHIPLQIKGRQVSYLIKFHTQKSKVIFSSYTGNSSKWGSHWYCNLWFYFHQNPFVPGLSFRPFSLHLAFNCSPHAYWWDWMEPPLISHSLMSDVSGLITYSLSLIEETSSPGCYTFLIWGFMQLFFCYSPLHETK